MSASSSNVGGSSGTSSSSGIDGKGDQGALGHGPTTPYLYCGTSREASSVSASASGYFTCRPPPAVTSSSSSSSEMPSSTNANAISVDTTREAFRNLVVARGCMLDIYSIGSDRESQNQLFLKQSLPICGCISSILMGRLSSDPTVPDCLFVLTEKKRFFIVQWNEIEKKAVYCVSGEVRDSTIRPDLETNHITFIEPVHRHLIGIYTQQNILRFLELDRIDAGTGMSTISDVHLESLPDYYRPIDFKFLYNNNSNSSSSSSSSNDSTTDRNNCGGFSRVTLCVLYEAIDRSLRFIVFDLAPHPISIPRDDGASFFFAESYCGFSCSILGSNARSLLPIAGASSDVQVLAIVSDTVVEVFASNARSESDGIDGDVSMGFNYSGGGGGGGGSGRESKYDDSSGNGSWGRGDVMVKVGSISIDGQHGPLVSMCAINDLPLPLNRFLAADEVGNLFQIDISLSSGFNETARFSSHFLGKGNVPSSLSFLLEDLVFLGSAYSNSQLLGVKFHSTSPTSSGTIRVFGSVQELHSYTNIGPIIDMVVVNDSLTSSSSPSSSPSPPPSHASTSTSTRAEHYLATCSGGFGSGTLRLIASGIEPFEQASIDLEGLRSVWSLKGGLDAAGSDGSNNFRSSSSSSSSRGGGYSQFDRYIVQSYVGETRIMAINGSDSDGENEVEEIEDTGAFLTNTATIFCCNMENDLILQVTANSLRLLNLSDFSLVHETFADSQVVLAKATSKKVIISCADGLICYFELIEPFNPSSSDAPSSQSMLSLVSSAMLEQDIASFSFEYIPDHVDPNLLQRMGQTPDTYVVIGFWNENTIQMLSLPSLEEIHRSLVKSDSQLRDILLLSTSPQGSFDLITYLYVGMGDGSVFRYTISKQTSHQAGFSNDMISITTAATAGRAAVATSHVSFGDERRVVAGSRPVSLSYIYSNGSDCIFVSCDRPTVLYEYNNTLQFSHVYIDETLSVTAFNCQVFPESLLAVTHSALKIVSLNSLQKHHIYTYPIGGSPRRLSYLSTSKVFAVTVEAFDPRSSSNMSSTIQFYSINSEQLRRELALVHQELLDDLEESMSSICCFLRLGEDEELTEVLVVGTAYRTVGDSESNQGRIRVYKVENRETVNAKQSSSSPRSSSTSNNSSSNTTLVVALIACEVVFGAVYSLAALSNGKLAAAINNKVSVFSLLSEPRGADNFRYRLMTEAKATHQCNTVAVCLKAHGNVIAVGDFALSVCLLAYGDSDGVLRETARDPESKHIRAIELVSPSPSPSPTTPSVVLGTDDCGNIFSLTRAPGESELRTFGEFYLGDYVNVIREGSLASQDCFAAFAATFASTTDFVSGSKDSKAVSSTPISSSEAANSSSSSSSSSLSSSSLSLSSPITSFSSYIFGTISGSFGVAIVIDAVSYAFFSALESSICTAIARNVFLIADLESFSNSDLELQLDNDLDVDVEVDIDSRDDKTSGGSGGGGSNNSGTKSDKIRRLAWRAFSNEARESPSRNIIDGDLVQSFKCFSRREQEYIVRLCNKFLERNLLGDSKRGDGGGEDLLLACSAKGFEVSVEEVCSRIDAVGLLH